MINSHYKKPEQGLERDSPTRDALGSQTPTMCVR